MANELTMEFGISGNGGEYRGTGWSEPEGTGTWMLGQQSLLVLPRPETQGDYRFEIDVGVLTGPGHPSQRLSVGVNGAVVAEFTFAKDAVEHCVLPWSVIGREPGLTLVLSHPDAWRPSELSGGEGDQREMSCFLRVARLSLHKAVAAPSAGSAAQGGSTPRPATPGTNLPPGASPAASPATTAGAAAGPVPARPVATAAPAPAAPIPARPKPMAPVPAPAASKPPAPAAAAHKEAPPPVAAAPAAPRPSTSTPPAPPRPASPQPAPPRPAAPQPAAPQPSAKSPAQTAAVPPVSARPEPAVAPRPAAAAAPEPARSPVQAQETRMPWWKKLLG